MSKKIGSKLADSVKQSRVNGSSETARQEATSPAPTAPSAPVAAKQSAKTEPRASYGVLHPSRVWPD